MILQQMCVFFEENINLILVSWKTIGFWGGGDDRGAHS